MVVFGRGPRDDCVVSCESAARFYVCMCRSGDDQAQVTRLSVGNILCFAPHFLNTVLFIVRPGAFVCVVICYESALKLLFSLILLLNY